MRCNNKYNYRNPNEKKEIIQEEIMHKKSILKKNLVQKSIESLNNQSKPSSMFGLLFGINNNKILFRDKFFKIKKWLPNNASDAEKFINKICTNMLNKTTNDKSWKTNI